MYCKYCGSENKETSSFCIHCGEPINKIAPTEKKPRKFQLKLKWILPLFLLFLFFIFSYVYSQRIYEEEIDFSSKIPSKNSDFDFYQNIAYEENQLVQTLDIKDLNAFLNSKAILKKIKLNDFTVKAIAFDEKESTLYLRIRNQEAKEIDLIGDYSVTLLNGILYLQFIPEHIGSDPFFFSSLALSKYGLQNIEIPLASSQELSKQILAMTLAFENPKIEISKKKMKLNYPILSTELIKSSAQKAEEDRPSKIEVASDEENKIIELSSYDLFTHLESTSDLEKIMQSYLPGEFYHDQTNLYYRYTLSDNDIQQDIKLVFNLELDDQGNKNLSLHEASIRDLMLSSDLEMIQEINTFLSDQRLAFLDSFTLLDSQLTNELITLTVNQTSWTIMVYMNGSDLESSYDPYLGELSGNATLDLDEMINGLNTENIHVVIETGGTLEWLMPEIDPSQNQRHKIEDGQLVHIDDLGLKNMTDPNTLIDFVDWSMNTYPSEKYALLMWNHGGGSLYGFGVDEYFPDDSLTLDELSLALSTISEKHSKQLEVIGFDACLMATLETAAVCAPYANFLIASEETEPSYGWDYDRIFKALGDGNAYDGNSFGELVVEGFLDYSVEANQEELLTLSVIDLSVIDEVIEDLNALTETISEDFLLADGYTQLARVIPQVKAFGGNTEFTGYTDHYDLESFAKKLIEYWPIEANRLIASLDNAIKYKASGYLASDAGGLSFYLPFYDLSYEESIITIYEPYTFSEEYLTFIDEFVRLRLDAADETPTIDYYVDSNTSPYTITVDASSDEYISSYYINTYVVYEDDPDLLYVDLGYDAWVFSTDTPHVYEEGFTSWAYFNDFYLPIFVTYYGDDYIEYETPILLNKEPATMLSAWIYEEERFVIFGARPNVGDIDSIENRNTITFNENDEIIVLYDIYSYYDDYWYQEEGTPYYVGSEQPIIENLTFQTDMSYALQFVLEDYNGELIYTDLIEFDYY